MDIRLLYFEGCPNAEPTYRLLRECLDQEKVSEPIVRTLVSDEAEASRYHFLGSPSIRIDGEDIDIARRGDTPVFACRVYDPTSTQPGVPSSQMILHAIRRAKEGER
jgi:hypothetical protein